MFECQMKCFQNQSVNVQCRSSAAGFYEFFFNSRFTSLSCKNSFFILNLHISYIFFHRCQTPQLKQTTNILRRMKKEIKFYETNRSKLVIQRIKFTLLKKLTPPPLANRPLKVSHLLIVWKRYKITLLKLFLMN